MKSLETLLSDGSQEALVGLLRRFDMTYDKSIEDEKEKNYVYENLRAKGEALVPALREGIKGAQSYSWPLRLAEDVAKGEQLFALIDDLMKVHPAGYERDPS